MRVGSKLGQFEVNRGKVVQANCTIPILVKLLTETASVYKFELL